MNYFKNEVYSGEIYFIRGGKAKEDGAYPASLMAQDNRPAVVISSQEDIDRSDSVFIIFLSKNATETIWHNTFFPTQAHVRFRGEDRAALCSHVFRLDKDELNEDGYMGEVTEDELLGIIDAVREGGFDGSSASLYSSERRDSVP